MYVVCVCFHIYHVDMVIFQPVQPTPHGSVHQSKDKQEGLLWPTGWLPDKMGPPTTPDATVFQIAAPVAMKLWELGGLISTATTTSAAPSALVSKRKFAPKSNERTGLLVFNKPHP